MTWRLYSATSRLDRRRSPSRCLESPPSAAASGSAYLRDMWVIGRGVPNVGSSCWLTSLWSLAQVGVVGQVANDGYLVSAMTDLLGLVVLLGCLVAVVVRTLGYSSFLGWWLPRCRRGWGSLAGPPRSPPPACWSGSAPRPPRATGCPRADWTTAGSRAAAGGPAGTRSLRSALDAGGGQVAARPAGNRPVPAPDHRRGRPSSCRLAGGGRPDARLGAVIAPSPADRVGLP